MSGLDRIRELERRLDNVVRFCVVKELDASTLPPSARVTDGEWESGWIPVAARRASQGVREWNVPEVGERVVVLAAQGEPELARILPASLYCTDTPPAHAAPQIHAVDYGDGARLTYDRQSSTLSVTVPEDGIVVMDAAGVSLRIEGGVLSVDATRVDVTADTIALLADAVALGGADGKKVARIGDRVNLQTGLIEEGSDVVTAT